MANFLSRYDIVMSAKELAIHLNDNNFKTNYNEKFKGGRGTYKLIRETWHTLNDELSLPNDAEKIAISFVKSNGDFAYDDY